MQDKPRKYSISEHLIALRHSLERTDYDSMISKILSLMNKSPSALRDYRVARLGDTSKQFTCSIADMRAIMACINEFRDTQKLTLRDMYHVEEYQKNVMGYVEEPIEQL